MSAPIIDRAAVEIMPDLRRFGTQAKTMITSAMAGVSRSFASATRGVETEVKNSSQRLGNSWKTGTDAVSKNTTAMARSVRDGSSSIGSAVDSIKTRTVALGAAIGTVAGYAVMGMARMAAGAIRSGLQTAAGIEQAQIGFTTLLGSGQKAKDFLANLQTFAAQTPFELPGLIDASRQLIGVGLNTKQTMSTLTAYGDAAGALGITQDGFNRIMLATSQALASGTLHAGDLLQMTEAGLPIWSLLAKALGKPVDEVRKLSEQGKLLTADVLPKLNAQMEKDYGGAMAKQSQTLAGLWSTLMDTFHMGMADVLLPLEPFLRDVLPKATKALGKGFKDAGQDAKEFLDGLAGNIEKGDRATSKFLDWGLRIRSLWQSFKEGDENAAGLEGVLGRVGVAWDTVSAAAQRFAKDAGPMLKDFWDKVKGPITDLVTSAIPVLINTWTSLKTPLKMVADFIITVVMPALAKIAGWANDHQQLMSDLLIGVGTFILAWKSMTKVKGWIDDAKLAMQGFNATTKANIILDIAAALVAIGVALYTAYQNSATFRATIQNAWSDIKIWSLETGQAVIRYMYIPILDVFSALVKGLAKLFAWAPDWMPIAGQIKKGLNAASDELDSWRESADDKLSGITVGIDTEQARMKANDLRVVIDDIKQHKVPGIDANTKEGKQKIAEEQAAIDALEQKIPPGITADNKPGLARVALLQKTISDIKQGKLPGINANTEPGKKIIAALEKQIADIKQRVPPPVTANTEPGKKLIATYQRQINEIKQGLVPGITANTWPGVVRIMDLQNRISTMQGTTVRIQVDWSSFYTNPANVEMYTVLGHNAAGGPIRGPGGPRDDKVLMWGSDGEYMIQAAAVNKYGRGLLDNINQMKFATGGPIIHQWMPPNSMFGTMLGQIHGIMNRLHIKDPLGFGLPLEKVLPNLGGAVPGGGAVSADVAAEQAYALSQFRYYLWPSSELSSLINLWNGESNWNPFALNASSGAYGIPQSLPAEKMASAGPDWRTNPATQIRWGEAYIASVYGTPSAAWGAWLSRSPHWYGDGLAPSVFRKPTLIGVGDRGPERVTVEPVSKRRSEPMVVELGPASIAALANAVSRQIVEMDGRQVAAIVSKYQELQARKGARR